MLLKLMARLLGVSPEKKTRHLHAVVQKINSFEEDMKKLSDEQLAGKTTEFRDRIKNGETLDELLPEAYAAVREASVRTTGLRHFDVQLLGGIVLHHGKISEMKTGEGKTLVATLPMYLNTLTGKGCHLITVNDYLAKRDSEWMGPIYKFLGLTVGTVQNDMDNTDRKAAYGCDIVYGTNNEFGFDYLRDNMATSINDCVQRELNFAIVDEVDNILIDEARTPLIISGMVDEDTQMYYKADQTSRKLQKDLDFTVDEKTKNAVLTETGIKKVEKLLGLACLYDVENMDLAHSITESLKAHHPFKKDVDYIVKDGEIIIVDEFTGRLMTGRRFSEGLHQAIEAKEGVQIRSESQTLATITFQNYFRLYKKLAGMTGTAMTEEAEFGKIYNLEVVEIPTHMKMVRTDHSDVIYKTKKEKFTAISNEIVDLYKIGRPVLVGTISIENSELLSGIMKRKGIPHHVLNAKHHEKEAEIIAKAGQKQAVTIATNMAGRGTDIVLGEGIATLGGLHIIGSERHESRRIDNQLRGRSGRQGDPGSSRFYVSLEDDLMKLFGSDRIKTIMERLGMEEGTPIEHGLISRAIENAQKKVEEYHFSMRKQILEYDDVMNKQREAIYGIRRRILEGADLTDKVLEMISSFSQDLADAHSSPKIRHEEWDMEGLENLLKDTVPFTGTELQLRDYKKQEDLKAGIEAFLKETYKKRVEQVGAENIEEIQRFVMLKVIDDNWIDQLHNMDALRDGIGLRAWGQKDPLIEYKMESFGMFQEMMANARKEIISLIFKLQIVHEVEPVKQKAKNISYGAFADTSSRQQPILTGEKTGRNDPCPCGSGKKYKKCCMK
ncbi:MAG: preprotein translocase subunit SecA [Candidatus Saganbacteria bacterium]|nr:preprotein translocase subunit SecA [Candidatus Saganbacteria bacterium]